MHASSRDLCCVNPITVAVVRLKTQLSSPHMTLIISRSLSLSLLVSDSPYTDRYCDTRGRRWHSVYKEPYERLSTATRWAG